MGYNTGATTKVPGRSEDTRLKGGFRPVRHATGSKPFDNTFFVGEGGEAT